MLPEYAYKVARYALTVTEKPDREASPGDAVQALADALCLVIGATIDSEEAEDWSFLFKQDLTTRLHDIVAWRKNHPNERGPLLAALNMAIISEEATDSGTV